MGKWKKTLATLVIISGMATLGEHIYTSFQRNLAALTNSLEETITFSDDSSQPLYSLTSSTTEKQKYLSPAPIPAEQEKYHFQDIVRMASLMNTINEDILMSEEPEFVPRIKAKDYGLAELCTGACVYVEMHGGYAKYDLQDKETTFTHKVCDEDNEEKPFCNFEVYTMDRYYLVINKEGEINEFGKIASSQDANDANDYVTVFNEEEYNDPDYNKDKEVEMVYYP